MIIDRLRNSDYAWLLENDFKIYPTDTPVTKKIINNWYINNPEFGIVFRDGNKIEGMNITIPLNRNGWEKLVAGELLESDCDDRYAFNNQRDREIGLHIYHIRRTGDSKDFYKESLGAINQNLCKLRKNNNGLTVVGFSALCCTKMGIGLFYNKLNCRERAHINTEHIFKKNEKLKIFEIKTQEEMNEKLQNDYVYLNRCKMLLTYPKKPSLVWSHIKAD